MRNYKLEDVDDFYEFMKLDSVAKYKDFAPFTYDESVGFIKQNLNDDEIIAVELKENGRLIGAINHSQEGKEGTYEIAYDFNHDFCHKGYAAEACTAMLDIIFHEIGGRRVISQCNDNNYSSMKLMGRMGMRRESYFLEDVTFKNDAEGNPIYILIPIPMEF